MPEKVDGLVTKAMEAVVDKVCSSDTLPSVPVVAANVLSLCKDPDVDFARLGAMVSADPALVAKMLRMANSPVFAGHTKVMTINDALVRMGIKVTRMTVLGFTLETEISKRMPKSFDIDRFWRHALTTATAARTVAERVCRQRRDEAFSSGILQDIGIVALQCAAPDAYEDVFAARRTDPNAELRELEMRIIGTTHEHVGSRLLQMWGLPEEVYEPVLYHHYPELAHAAGLSQVSVEVAELLHLATNMATLFNYNRKTEAHDSVFAFAKEKFGLEENVVEDMLGRIERGVRDTCDLFSLDPRSIASYSEVKVQAAQEVARLALELGQEKQDAESSARRSREELDLLRNEADELRKLASHDDLTALLNRREFMKAFVNEMVRCRRYGHALGLLMFDVDHFKTVNDTFGHPVGDQVLRGIGHFVRERMLALRRLGPLRRRRVHRAPARGERGGRRIRRGEDPRRHRERVANLVRGTGRHHRERGRGFRNARFPEFRRQGHCQQRRQSPVRSQERRQKLLTMRGAVALISRNAWRTRSRSCPPVCSRRRP